MDTSSGNNKVRLLCDINNVKSMQPPVASIITSQLMKQKFLLIATDNVILPA